MHHFSRALRDDLVSVSRKRELIIPRHVSMYLAKELTALSLGRIGRVMCRNDHTLVRFAHRKIEELLKSDTQLAAKVALIRGQFE